MPGKIFFDSGMTRFEMNLSDAKVTATCRRERAAQMKSMGLDQMITITHP